jgi:hypothetical protein
MLLVAGHQMVSRTRSLTSHQSERPRSLPPPLLPPQYSVHHGGGHGSAEHHSDGGPPEGWSPPRSTSPVQQHLEDEQDMPPWLLCACPVTVAVALCG